MSTFRSRTRLTGTLAVLAGSTVALAQPVIDGVRDASYGNPVWVNSNATGYGNNGDPAEPCDGSTGSTGSFQGCYAAGNPGGLTNCGNDSTGLRLTLDNSNVAGVTGADVGMPDLVTTGVEFSIPVAQLGSFGLGATIRMVAAINGQGHDFFSNQFLPGLPVGSGNVGEPGMGDLNTFAGDQFASFVPALVTTAPVIDGSITGDGYGAAVALQTTATGFGDSNLGLIGPANGSELDGLYVVRHDNGTPGDGSDDVLYVCITGNVESNFNKLEVFFDTIDGAGQNRLFNTNVDVDFNGLNRMANFTFDAGFAADFWIGGGAGNDPVTMFPNYATLPTCPPPPPPPTGDVDFAAGSEIDAVYAQVDIPNNRLYLLVTGNVETGAGGVGSNGGNKLHLFFDCAAGGQSRLLGSNVDISFGNLNRMGEDLMNPGGGMLWDPPFAPEYWYQYKNIGTLGSVNHASDCATIRTDGRILVPFLGGTLDYGAYYGGPKSDMQYNPATFNGNSAAAPMGFIDPNFTDGSLAAIYTNFAPRLTGESLYASQTMPPYLPPFDIPVGAMDKITFNMNNTNTAGVSGTEGTGGELVTTGFELSIDLTELGWDGTSPILLAGFISNPDASELSNQVIGGLPPGAANLGGPSRTIDFTMIDGTQHITLFAPSAPCPADFNNDGNIDPDDLGDFINCYFSVPPCDGADFNDDGNVDPDDLGDFINIYFQTVGTGC